MEGYVFYYRYPNFIEFIQKVYDVEQKKMYLHEDFTVEKSIKQDSTGHLCHFLSNYTCAKVKPELDTDQQTIIESKQGASAESLNKEYPSRTKTKVIKVDQARIDSIMDLVGELVVAKNALPFLAKRAEEEFSVRPLAKEIKAQYTVINRLSEELR